MIKKYRDPDYYSFQALAKKLDISQDRIEQDFRTRKINRFLIDNLYVESSEATMRRICKLMPLLNEYAREHLFDGPVKILTCSIKNEIKISEVQKKILRTNLNSDVIFSIWLKEFGIDINTIKIAIPQDEAVKYENYLQEDLEGVTLPEDGAKALHHSVLPEPTVIEAEKSKTYNFPDREKIRPRDKSPLTKVVEHIFEEKEKGADVDIRSWDSINIFLGNELERKAMLSDGKIINYYVAKIITKGSERGIEMKHNIPGRLYGQPEKLYSHKYFREIFAKVRKKRTN